MMVLEHGTDQSERELRELTRLIPEPVAGWSHYPATEQQDGAFHKGIKQGKEGLSPPTETKSFAS